MVTFFNVLVKQIVDQDTSDKPKIVVCIPAYNESKSISNIVQGARKYCSTIIVCDDGSVDQTSEMARAAGATVIRHNVNRGYGSAIKTLFNAAKELEADIMITLDSDGQHDPSQIPDIITPVMRNQADIVIGSRFLIRNDREKVPKYRTLGIKALTKLTHIVSYNNITDAQSGFRAYSKKALSSIRLREDGMAVSTEILVRAKDSNLRIKEVPVTIAYDIEDTSTHNPFSHGLNVLTSIIRFISVRHPLTFYGIPGLVSLLIAGVFAALTINVYSAEGFFSLNMTVLAIGLGIFGLILIVAGVILYIIANTKVSE